MDEVIQRSIHLIYFAVRGNACPGVLRVSIENCFVIRASKSLASCKRPKNARKASRTQLNTASAICHKEAELARIETSALADIQTLHFIFIIADEYQGRLARQLLSVQAQANAKKRVVLSEPKGRLGRKLPTCCGLSSSAAPRGRSHDARIDAQAGIVEEDAAVDFTDIHGYGAAVMRLRAAPSRSCGMCKSFAK